MTDRKLNLIQYIVTAIIAISACSCSTHKTDKNDFQIMIVEAPLQCTDEPKELKAECKCPKSTEGIATIISSVGSVIGNLISTLWN